MHGTPRSKHTAAGAQLYGSTIEGVVYANIGCGCGTADKAIITTTTAYNITTRRRRRRSSYHRMTKTVFDERVRLSRNVRGARRNNINLNWTSIVQSQCTRAQRTRWIMLRVMRQPVAAHRTSMAIVPE